MNKKELRLIKKYIDTDLKEYFIGEEEQSDPLVIALRKLSKEMGRYIRTKKRKKKITS